MYVVFCVDRFGLVLLVGGFGLWWVCVFVGRNFWLKYFDCSAFVDAVVDSLVNYAHVFSIEQFYELVVVDLLFYYGIFVVSL